MNLFSSEEEIQKWLERHPDLRTREVYGVQEFLDKHRRGELNELIL